MVGVGKAALFLGTWVCFFVSKTYSIQADRFLSPLSYDFYEKGSKEKGNHKESLSLVFSFMGLLLMVLYLIIFTLSFFPPKHVEWTIMGIVLDITLDIPLYYADIPLTFLGIAGIFIILELPEWYKGLRWASVPLGFFLITAYIVNNMI